MRTLWQRMREAGAASSAAALERASGTGTSGVDTYDADNDGDNDSKTDQSGDGDSDDTQCATCSGSGIDGGEVCSTCNGSGSQMSGVEATAEAAKPATTKTCPTCKGTGKIKGGLPCPSCKGSGKVPIDWAPKASTGNPFAKGKESTVCATCLQADCEVEGTEQLREATLTTKQRNGMDTSSFALPSERAYPIHDKSHAANALARASGKPEEATVKAAVYKKYPDMKSKESGSLLERLERLESSLVVFKSLREAKPGVLNATYSTPTRVKTDDGREGYKVVLIREGRGNADDDNWYTGDSIRELCEAGVAEGMQAYANHPDLEEEVNRPERDVKQLVGSYADVTFSESGGVPRAEAVFVPLTTNESHPTYGWVVTLAEAASNNTGPQPLAGISLYGLSAGDFGARPDGSEGRVVTLIRPTSGDIVTNAGAGGEFVRNVLRESARRLRRAETQGKDTPMQLGTFRSQMAEALAKLSEATSDEQRSTAMEAVKTLQEEAGKIDAPPAAPDSIEALTESAPALVAKLREAVKAEAATTVEALQAQLKESQAKNAEADQFVSRITEVQAIGATLREAGVTDEKELRHFAQQAKILGLRETADIQDMVKAERDYQKTREDAILGQLREAMDLMDLPEVEGVFSRTPEGGGTSGDGGAALLRESGIPTKTSAAA